MGLALMITYRTLEYQYRFCYRLLSSHYQFNLMLYFSQGLTLRVNG